MTSTQLLSYVRARFGLLDTGTNNTGPISDNTLAVVNTVPLWTSNARMKRNARSKERGYIYSEIAYVIVCAITYVIVCLVARARAQFLHNKAGGRGGGSLKSP